MHASVISSWQENLSKDEVPPHWMWPFDSVVSEWFEMVDKQREKKYKNDDIDSNWEETEMDDNELIKDARRQMGLM